MASLHNSATLFGLPTEVLLNICRHLTTPSFIQLTSTCRKLFQLAEVSRELLLQHLNDVPGIKLGLEDHSLSTEDLWMLLRQRTSAHLYGAHFNADCQNFSLRSGDLNSTGSSITDFLGQIHFSVACRDSLKIRHYSLSTPIDITSSPYADGVGRVIHVVRHGHFISALYAWQQPKSSHRSSPRPNSQLHPTLPALRDRAIRIPTKSNESTKRDRSASSSFSEAAKTRYHLVHYDVHNHDRPLFFTIKPPKPSKLTKFHSTDPIPVPIHLSIHNLLKVAITWSESHLGLRHINMTIVCLYVADRLPPRFEEGTYTSFKIFPSRARPPPPSSENGDETRDARDARDRFEKDLRFYSLHRPAATRFRLQGTRLSLYAVGGTVPFTTATIDSGSATTLANAPLSRTYDRVVLNGYYFCMDSAFWGIHHFGSTASPDNVENDTTGVNPDHECTHVYLHLATMSRMSPDYHPDAPPNGLFIIQARCPTPSDECSHYVDLDSGQMPTRGMRGWESRVVARLWGWKPPVTSTMTGLDTVCVSKGGTRVAVSYWDRVLIWAIQPEVLAEEWGEDDEEEDDENESSAANEGGNGDNESDALSDAGSAAEPGGHAQVQNAEDSHSAASEGSEAVRTRKGMIRATRYYNITRDNRLGEIVELRPIVIKLADGAVARKMVWKTPSRGYDSDSDDTDSEDSVSDIDEDPLTSSGPRQPDPSNESCARIERCLPYLEQDRLDMYINRFNLTNTIRERIELISYNVARRNTVVFKTRWAARTGDPENTKQQLMGMDEWLSILKIEDETERKNWREEMIRRGNERLVQLAYEEWFDMELMQLVEDKVFEDPRAGDKNDAEDKDKGGASPKGEYGDEDDEKKKDESSSEIKNFPFRQVRGGAESNAGFVKPSLDWARNKLLEATIEEIEDVEDVDEGTTALGSNFSVADLPTFKNIQHQTPQKTKGEAEPTCQKFDHPSINQPEVPVLASEETIQPLKSRRTLSSEVMELFTRRPHTNEALNFDNQDQEAYDENFSDLVTSHDTRPAQTAPSIGSTSDLSQPEAPTDTSSTLMSQQQRRMLRIAKGKAPVRDTIDGSLDNTAALRNKPLSSDNGLNPVRDPITSTARPPSAMPDEIETEDAVQADPEREGNEDSNHDEKELDETEEGQGEAGKGKTRTQIRRSSIVASNPVPTGSPTPDHSLNATDSPIIAPVDSRSRPRLPSPSPSPSHTQQHQRIWHKKKKMKRKKRISEDELVIMTDRGIQVWNLGVWAKGRREKGWLEECPEGWDGEGEGDGIGIGVGSGEY